MKKRFLLLQVIQPNLHAEAALADMQEVSQLVSTYGGVVVETAVQHRVHPDLSTYVGPGKVVWLQEQLQQQKLDVVVLNDVVKSGQLFRLEKALWSVNPQIQVWDRVDLILHIFNLHATSTVAKLQIKMAMINHRGPRAYGLGGGVLSKQGGGIGTRGKGETNIEIERRRSRRELQRLEQQIAKASLQQASQMQQRKDKGIFTIALVGYTSAGKTSLFNALTKKQKIASNSLFTTLDSITGRMNPRNGQRPIIISDTIGFIQDLPPTLISAFRSTLEESVRAHLLLEVVDIADDAYEQKHAVVVAILETLGVTQPVVLVANKQDLLPMKVVTERIQKLEKENCVVSVSTKNGEGLPSLRHHIHKHLDRTFPSDESDGASN